MSALIVGLLVLIALGGLVVAAVVVAATRR